MLGGDLGFARIDHINRVAGKVDKDLLATHMRLPHRWAHPAFPGVEVRAKPGMAKPVRREISPKVGDGGSGGVLKLA